VLLQAGVRPLGFLAITSASLISHSAAAEVTRCAGADADLQYHASDLAELNGDTGWVPSGSAAQVRITGRIAGETTVAMGVHPTACWPSAMDLSVPGRTDAGMLDFAYGAELHLFAQIHTSILGKAIDWQGEIPVPLLPADLMLANTTTFDPSVGAVAAARDTTSPITVLTTNLIGNYIGITGISGGLHLDVTGAMTTSYVTTSMTTGAGTLANAGDHLAVPTPSAGFGAALDTPLSAAGRVTYAPSLIFTIAFDVKILGIRVVNWQLFSIPMALPSIDRDVTLAGADAHISLPKADPLAGSKIDFALAATQQLAVHNAGEAPLMLEATGLPAGVSISMARVTVAPGATKMLEVVATDDALAGVTGQFVLTTNDPGQPTVMITLGRDIGGTGMDTGDEAAHAGCDAGAGGAGLLIALATLRLRRRRR
jgi:hypothetical protein